MRRGVSRDHLAVPIIRGPLLLDAGDPINKGLLGFWPLDFSGGAVSRDISPNRRHGAITTSTNAGGAGVLGRVTNFDGSSTYIRPSGTILSTVISVSVWARSGITGTPGWNRMISTKSNYNSPEGWEITLVSGSNTDLIVSANLGSSLQANVVSNWATGTWHHIVVVYNGTSVSIYADGLLKGSGTINAITSTAVPLVFGDNTALNEARWNGSLSAARVYNRVLVPNDVHRLYRDRWAGTRRLPRRATNAGTYALAVDPLAYEYGASAVGLSSARRISVDPLAYTYGAQDVGLSYRQGAHTLDVEPLAYTYGAASVGLTFSGAAAPAGPSRTRRGARKIYMPEPQASAVFHPNALPDDLAAHAVKAWQDDEDDETWFLLA